jgi:hypothetical protein
LFELDASVALSPFSSGVVEEESVENDDDDDDEKDSFRKLLLFIQVLPPPLLMLVRKEEGVVSYSPFVFNKASWRVLVQHPRCWSLVLLPLVVVVNNDDAIDDDDDDDDVILVAVVVVGPVKTTKDRTTAVPLQLFVLQQLLLLFARADAAAAYAQPFVMVRMLLVV